MLKNILLIKTSSMGDVIHTLPAIQDAVKNDPSLRFHWVVEAPFAEITRWHPNVQRSIPVRLRYWRKHLWQTSTWQAWRAFKRDINSIGAYDAIIDAQGLMKSAYLSRLANGPRHGFDKSCAREPLASRLYQHQYAIDPTQHAITRTRELFSSILGYTLGDLDYGINPLQFIKTDQALNPYLVFLHGTTWVTKHWPEMYWTELAKLATTKGYTIQLLWGNKTEKQRAEKIASQATGQIHVHPKLNLTDAASVIAGATGVIAVDTGLGHLAAALGTPTLSLYGPTNPQLTGTVGQQQAHLGASQPSCAPCLQRVCTYQGEVGSNRAGIGPACFAPLTPQRVWQQFLGMIQ